MKILNVPNADQTDDEIKEALVFHVHETAQERIQNIKISIKYTRNKF